MKKVLIGWLMLLCTAPLWAQNDSLPATFPEEPVYDDEYQTPNINPIYYFGSPFCEHFLEAKVFAGRHHIGYGVNYAYLPEVWGGHLSGYFLNNSWVMAGPDYRLSKPWQAVDWHLYGSVGMCYDEQEDKLHPGMELGFRIASPTGSGIFSVNSATLGVMTDCKSLYVSMGLSISFSVFLSLFIFIL